MSEGAEDRSPADAMGNSAPMNIAGARSPWYVSLSFFYSSVTLQKSAGPRQLRNLGAVVFSLSMSVLLSQILIGNSQKNGRPLKRGYCHTGHDYDSDRE